MKAPAHFFKFIPPASNSHLSVPKSFRKYLKSTRKNKIAILRRGNQKWGVKIGKDWVFGEGWDNFITDNGVQHFDFVVFKHEDNMVFDTMVFDPTWCERDYSNNQVAKSSRKQKLDNNALKISKGKDKCINQSTTMVPDQTHHPYFVGTLKQYDPLSKTMFLPKKFALANGLSNGEMILKNMENEGLWTVKLRNQSGNRFIIQQGMCDFCIAIGLEKGDSFRFELVRKGKKPVAVVSKLPKAALINPYFRSTVTATTIKGAYMNVLLPFARSNKLDKRKCELFVMDEKQRLWPTHLYDPGGHLRISRVRDMLVANGLKEGDEFLLELVDNGNKPLINLHMVMHNC